MSEEWISSLSNLKVNDLKEELRKRDLPVSGRKAELLERLIEAARQEGKDANGAVAEDPDDAGQEPSGKEPEAEAETAGQSPSANGDNAMDKPPEKQTSNAATTAEAAETDKESQPEKAAEEKTEPIAGNEPTSTSDVSQAHRESVLPEAGDLPESDEIQKIEAAAIKEALNEQNEAPQAAASDQKDSKPPETSSKTESKADDAKDNKLPPSARNKPDAPLDVKPEPQNSKPKSKETQDDADKTASAAEPNKDKSVDKSESNLAAMQAALAAPAPVAQAPAEPQEEEEVDFEAEEDPAPQATTAKPKESGRGLKRAVEKPSGGSKAVKDETAGDKSSAEGTASKRQRQPIPSFKSLNSGKAPALTPQPSTATTDKDALASRKSVFDRVGGASEEKPHGPGAPPSRAPATNSLLVTGFVRPFTVKAAQALFESHGTVTKFWMPMIRDKAVVIFETTDAAEEARQAVHGLEWPTGARTSLRPKFISSEEADATVAGTANGKEISVRGSGLSQKGSGVANTAADAATKATQEVAQKRKPEKELEESTEKVLPAKRAKTETVKEPEEDKVVNLEDLFRKTKANPNIYWLPLTEAQIAAKQKAKALEKLQSQKGPAPKPVEPKPVDRKEAKAEVKEKATEKPQKERASTREHTKQPEKADKEKERETRKRERSPEPLPRETKRADRSSRDDRRDERRSRDERPRESDRHRDERRRRS